MIVSTGEQVSIALISMALKEIGLKGKPLLGWQIPINGSNDFTKAKINKIDDKLILELMNSGEIPIIAVSSDKRDLKVINMGVDYDKYESMYELLQQAELLSNEETKIKRGRKRQQNIRCSRD